MIKLSNPDEIYRYETKELWAVINLLEKEEIEEYSEELKQIKNGINLKFPIIYIIKGWTTEYPENKRVHIKGHGKENIVNYYDEIDERNALMRKIILENLENNDITTPRT